MTNETRDLDAIADDIVGPHAAAQAKATQELAQRRRARMRTVRIASALIAVAFSANILYRYVQHGTFEWSSVAVAIALVAGLVASRQRR